MTKAAETGDSKAQYDLAVHYALGSGVEQDGARAFELVRQSANGGYARAQAALGQAYDKGIRVAHDPKEAAQWYLLAAIQGDAPAQFSLARLYRNGDGVAKNLAVALEWYERAATHDHAEALNDLGLLFQHGEGVTKDEARAIPLFRRAAAAGSVAAKHNLAVAYLLGQGVTPDFATAAQWFDEAASNDPKQKWNVDDVLKQVAGAGNLQATRLIANQSLRPVSTEGRESVIREAMEKHNVDIARILIETWGDVNQALLWALRTGELEMARRFVAESQPTLSAAGRESAILEAMNTRNIDIVRALLRPSGDNLPAYKAMQRFLDDEYRNRVQYGKSSATPPSSWQSLLREYDFVDPGVLREFQDAEFRRIRVAVEEVRRIPDTKAPVGSLPYREAAAQLAEAAGWTVVGNDTQTNFTLVIAANLGAGQEWFVHPVRSECWIALSLLAPGRISGPTAAMPKCWSDVAVSGEISLRSGNRLALKAPFFASHWRNRICAPEVCDLPKFAENALWATPDKGAASFAVTLVDQLGKFAASGFLERLEQSNDPHLRGIGQAAAKRER